MFHLAPTLSEVLQKCPTVRTRRAVLRGAGFKAFGFK